MKMITQLLMAAIFAAAPFAGAQTMGGMESSNGFQASKKDGMVAKLMSWQKFGMKNHNEKLYDPKQKMLARFGIRQESLTSDSFDFYGGESYKGNSVPMASVTDAGGNTYVTGGSTNENHPAGDFFTMKVGPDGTVLWQVREEAAQYAVEYGINLLLDSNGHLVVTGLKWNGNDMDIHTVKYTPDGTEVWNADFDSPYEGIDVPSGMVSGADGSIYITGISWSGESVDYLTLKYNADGSLAWQARNNGVGADSWNEPTAIALDSNGNVIVTGYSSNPDGWLDYHTIKYTPLGEIAWEQSYNYVSTDPENPSDVTNSTPRAIAIDANDNIYITGTFDTFLGRIGTIKYNEDGVEQWIETYKSGTEKTLGWKAAINDDVLYVAGVHNGGFSSDGNVLISYGLDGTENWVEETNDLVDAINVELLFDAEGNPVVAAKGMTPGEEEWMMDNAARAKIYSVGGTLLGQAAFVISSPEGLASMGNMAGLGLDTNGNAYFAINSFYTAQGAVYEVVKSAFAEESPETEWNTVYSNLGSPGASMLNSFADNHGNTISTGAYYTFDGAMLNSNYFIVKHDSEGNIAWEAVYNIDNGNAANGIMGCADSEGNIFVCLVPNFGEPLTVKKLSPAGTELWEEEIGLFNPAVYVMQSGPGGSLYLGGTAFEQEADSNASFVGIKFSASGDVEWTTYTGSGTAGDNIFEINGGRVGKDGEFYITGTSGTGDFMSQEVDLTVVKFNPDGTAAWSTKVPVEGSVSNGTDLLVADGAVYVNGFAKSTTTYYDNIVTAKLSTDGAVLWANEFGDSSRDERSYTIKRFSNGHVAVIGYSLALNGDIHNALIKYDTSGNEMWNFASENMRYYNDFHIDGSDVCYIMDQALTDPFPHKIYHAPFPIASLVTVDASGNGEEEFFVGPEYAEFYGERLIPHADDRLLLGGSINNQAFFEGLYFFETEHNGTLGIGKNEPEKNGNALGQNYPNPVTNSTDIPFFLVNGGKAVIKLYNSQGRLVREIANDTFSPGNNTIHFEAAGLAPGIYFYQITSGKFKQARKMVIR